MLVLKFGNETAFNRAKMSYRRYTGKWLFSWDKKYAVVLASPDCNMKDITVFTTKEVVNGHKSTTA